MGKKEIFTILCEPQDGNKGVIGCLNVEANSLDEAITNNTKILQEKLVKEGHNPKYDMNITGFKPKDLKKAKKELGEFRYYKGDPRL